MKAHNRKEPTADELADTLKLGEKTWCALYGSGGSRYRRLKAEAQAQQNTYVRSEGEEAPPPSLSEPTVEEATWEDYYHTITKLSKIDHALDPDITDDTVVWGRTREPVGMLFSGDWHIGSKWCDYEQLEADMKYLGAWREKNPGALHLVHTGDPTDAFLPGMGKASSGLFEELVTRVDKQEALFTWVAQKAGGWDYLLLGCHNAWQITQAGRDPLIGIINSLESDKRNLQVPDPATIPAVHTTGAKNGGYGINLSIRVGTEDYVVTVRHRMRRESSLNTTNAQRAMDDELGPALAARADVVALGHMHYNDLQSRPKANRVVHYIRNGAYKGGDNYARAIGATMTKGADIGNPVVIFLPDQHRVLAYHGHDWKRGLKDLADIREHYVRTGEAPEWLD